MTRYIYYTILYYTILYYTITSISYNIIKYDHIYCPLALEASPRSRPAPPTPRRRSPRSPGDHTTYFCIVLQFSNNIILSFSLSLSIYIYIYIHIAIRVLCWGTSFRCQTLPTKLIGAESGRVYIYTAPPASHYEYSIFVMDLREGICVIGSPGEGRISINYINHMIYLMRILHYDHH